MKSGSELISKVNELQDKKKYQELNWEGSFEQYLDIVLENPKVTRNAFQRIYDMIVTYGSFDFHEYKKKITRYQFFDDPFEAGKDSVFGIDLHLMKLVRVFKSAAMGYGTEKRIILLHGPVGSAKSTIARLLKKGLVNYSKANEGALYTFKWQRKAIFAFRKKQFLYAVVVVQRGSHAWGGYGQPGHQGIGQCSKYNGVKIIVRMLGRQCVVGYPGKYFLFKACFRLLGYAGYVCGYQYLLHTVCDARCLPYLPLQICLLTGL